MSIYRSIQPAGAEIFGSKSGVDRLEDWHAGAEGQGVDLATRGSSWASLLSDHSRTVFFLFATLLPLSAHPVSRSSGAPRASPLLFLCYMLSLESTHSLMCQLPCMYILLKPKYMFTAQSLPEHQPILQLPTDISLHNCPTHVPNSAVQHHSFSIQLIILYSLSWKMKKKNPLIV